VGRPVVFCRKGVASKHGSSRAGFRSKDPLNGEQNLALLLRMRTTWKREKLHAVGFPFTAVQKRSTTNIWSDVGNGTLVVSPGSRVCRLLGGGYTYCDVQIREGDQWIYIVKRKAWVNNRFAIIQLYAFSAPPDTPVCLSNCSCSLWNNFLVKPFWTFL
jgi:hypothetical protein